MTNTSIRVEIIAFVIRRNLMTDEMSVVITARTFGCRSSCRGQWRPRRKQHAKPEPRSFPSHFLSICLSVISFASRRPVSVDVCAVCKWRKQVAVWLTECKCCRFVTHKLWWINTRRRSSFTWNFRVVVGGRGCVIMYVCLFSRFLRATAYMLSAHMLSQFRPSVRPSVRLSVCLSVCLSVTRVIHTKTIVARIVQFSPYSSPIPLVFAR